MINVSVSTNGKPVQVTLSLDIHPVAKGRPRFSRGGHAYTPAKTRAFEKTVRMLAMSRRPPKPFAGPLNLTVVFYLKPPKKRVRTLPTCKPDLDNLVKGIKDALNGVIWKDDAQIVMTHLEKRYDWEERKGRIEVNVKEITEEACFDVSDVKR